MKAFVLYLSMIVGSLALSARTFGSRMSRSLGRLVGSIFLPRPPFKRLPGGRSSRRPGLDLRELVRYEKALATDLGSRAKEYLRQGHPRAAQAVARNAFYHWKVARRAGRYAKRALPAVAE